MEGLVERGTIGSMDALTPRAETIQEMLGRKRSRLAQQLADVDAAIAAVNSQPGVIEAFDALRKVGF